MVTVTVTMRRFSRGKRVKVGEKMGDKWRPEGWGNPYPMVGVSVPENIPWSLLHNIYEAGANAMLEALRGIGDYWLGDACDEECHLFPSLVHRDKLTERVKGHLVFIPDEGAE